MVFTKSSKVRQAGFSQGAWIWIIVLVIIGMIVKNEFAPGISKGTSVDSLLYKFGQPVAKTAMPRPG